MREIRHCWTDPLGSASRSRADPRARGVLESVLSSQRVGAEERALLPPQQLGVALHHVELGLVGLKDLRDLRLVMGGRFQRLRLVDLVLHDRSEAPDERGHLLWGRWTAA